LLPRRLNPLSEEAVVISPLRAAEHRILVVDDEQPVLDAVGEYLSAYGFTVDAAAELEEAEALLATAEYSLMIADVRLTGMHGREGLELLRFARRHCPEIRVIVMTAHAAGDLEHEARRRGADAFVEKPLPLSDLLFEVHHLLETGRAAPAAGSRDG
jgi:two-component system response regulator FlrC